MKNLILLLTIFLFSCGSPNGDIDTTRMGVNNFFINQEHNGSMKEQAKEITETLKLKSIRILFSYQRLSDIPNSFSFYDDIVAALPEDVEVLGVITSAPPQFQNLDPAFARRLWVDEYLTAIVDRYKSVPQIKAFQIWNEPNTGFLFPENNWLDVTDKPENYLELLAMGEQVVRELAPDKLIVSASTTSLIQNFPDTLHYFEGMLDGGLEELVDIVGIHIYGDDYIKLSLAMRNIDHIQKPIWVTESGERGTLNQLDYVKNTWPRLREGLLQIDKIFFYQMYDSDNRPERTEGLRSNLNTGQELSDLYIYLRDRE